MEKTVSRKKRQTVFWKRVYPFFKISLPFRANRSTFFVKRVYLFFFGLVLYENATNAVRHRMHGIRFQAIKRFKRKWFVRQHCKTSVCTHKLHLLPSSNCRGDQTVITPFSSVKVQNLSNNKSSIMINFQRNLYEKIQRKSCPMAAKG